MNTEDMRQHFEADGSPRRLDSRTDVGVGSSALFGALPWKVNVTVYGANAGDYEHATFEEAKKMADERNAKFRVLGCHYRIIPPANECRCCGKPGVYVRTRYFETMNSDVWECQTDGCENHGLIWHTDSPNPKAEPDGQSI